MIDFSKFDNKNFHNFSISVLNSYFNLFELIEKQKVKIYDDNIIHVKSIKEKVFVFSKKI